MAGKQKFQMVDVNEAGLETILHPETNADQVLTGLTFKVPTIVNIEDWIAKSNELVNARKGKVDLKTKIDEIDLSLTPAKLLEALIKVDGSGSGLDADMVDGRTVDDTLSASTNLWTASKTLLELNKKVNSTDVASIATPNKLLLLDANGRLKADVVGNSTTATSWAKSTTINLIGDVDGTMSIKGNESVAVSVDVQVKDNSHLHSSLVHSGGNSIVTDASNLASFKKGNSVVSSIDLNGNFTGSSSAVNGLSVDDSSDVGALWSNGRVIEELGEMAQQILGSTSLDEASGTITLSGLIKIKYGTVDIATRNSLDVVFSEAFGSKVLFDGYSIATTDPTFVCNKTIDGVSTSGISYNFNQPAVDGTLTWFAVGI